MTRANGIIRGIMINNEKVQVVLNKNTMSLQPCVPHTVSLNPFSLMDEK
jgi:hypothetical protein